MAITQLKFEAIGTRWEIEIYDGVPDARIKVIKQSIMQRIETFDRTYSRFREDSTLMQLSQKAGSYELPDDARPLFELYESLYRATDGKVTPLIGNVLADAGYDASYRLQPKANVTTAPKWEDVLDYDHPTITAKQPVILDVGAAGKGYLVDIIGSLLEEQGINEYLIDASGDMLHHRAHGQTVRIGLEHPTDPSQAIGVLELSSGSVCGSAVNRRQWADLHHIMDPDSAQPVRDIIAAWVTADAAMVADGLTTALFFTPAATLRKTFNFEYLIVRSDLSFESSPGLKAEIFQ